MHLQFGWGFFKAGLTRWQVTAPTRSSQPSAGKKNTQVCKAQFPCQLQQLADIQHLAGLFPLGKIDDAWQIYAWCNLAY